MEVPGKVNHWRSRTIIYLLATNLLYCGVDLPIQEVFLQQICMLPEYLLIYLMNAHTLLSVSICIFTIIYIYIYTTMINYMWHMPNKYYLIYHVTMINPNTSIWHMYVPNQYIDQYIDQYIFSVHFFYPFPLSQVASSSGFVTFTTILSQRLASREYRGPHLLVDLGFLNKSGFPTLLSGSWKLWIYRHT